MMKREVFSKRILPAIIIKCNDDAIPPFFHMMVSCIAAFDKVEVRLWIKF